jgi:hypothetical protein
MSASILGASTEMGKQMKRTFALAAFTVMLAAPSFAADAPELKADLRCLVVMVNLSAAPENAKKMEALIGGFYFMGRLDARDPRLDIEKRVIAEVQAMTPAEVVEENVRCEKEFHARVDALATMSENIAKRLDEDDKKAQDQKDDGTKGDTTKPAPTK